MSSRSPRIEFAVGAFLLLALASLLVLAIASTNGRLSFGGGDTYPVMARFTGIGQLRGQAPVKIGGVTVGKVGEIGLDPTTFDSVVTLEIDRRYELPGDTSAAILTSGLLGESYVSLQPGGDPMALQPGDELMLTQPAVDLMQLVGKYMFSGGGENAAPGDAAPEASESTDPAQTEDTP